MLRVIRISLSVYILIIALTSLIGLIQTLLTPKDTIAELFSAVGVIMPLLFSFFYFYASYAVFKDQKDRYPAFLGLFAMQLIISLAITFSGTTNTNLFETNPIPVIILYGIPLALLSILIISNHKHSKKESLVSARSILGEHTKDLTDDQLKELLKH